MKLILLSVIFLSMPSHALEPAVQVLIDQLLTPQKVKLNAVKPDTPDSRLKKLNEQIEALELQYLRIDTIAKNNQKRIEVRFAELERVQKTMPSPYRIPQWREKLTEKLQEDCCKMVRDPTLQSERAEHVGKAWKKAVQKWEEEQKKLPK